MVLTYPRSIRRDGCDGARLSQHSAVQRRRTLHQLVPRATSIAVLVDPKGPGPVVDVLLHDTPEAASAPGVQVSTVTAATESAM